MDTLQILGIVLAFGILAGLNLPLSIFITGICLKFGWTPELLALAPGLKDLSSWPVIAIAFVFVVIEFIADKIKWVDSLWDFLQSIVRPAGAIMLAYLATHLNHGVFIQTIGMVIAFTGGIIVHTNKTGLRLATNGTGSSTPNRVLSLVEDLLVVAGFLLMANYPKTSFFFFAGLFILMVFLIPASLRSIRATAWLAWKKLRASASSVEEKTAALPTKLTTEQEAALRAALPSDRYHLAWCVPCLTGKLKGHKGVSANLFGTLIATKESPETLIFIPKKKLKEPVAFFSIDGCDAHHESRLLSEVLVIRHPSKKQRFLFHLPWGQAGLTERLHQELRTRLNLVSASAQEKAAQEEEVAPAENPVAAGEDKPEAEPVADTVSGEATSDPEESEERELELAETPAFEESEEIADAEPVKIATLAIDPTAGYGDYELRPFTVDVARLGKSELSD